MLKTFEEYINEAKLPEFDHETTDIDELRDYIKDNYESKWIDRVERMHAYKLDKGGVDSTILNIPVYYDKSTTTLCYLTVEYFKEGKKSISFSQMLAKKLDNIDDQKWENLKDTMEQAYKDGKICNEFMIWTLDKMIETLGKDACIQKKEK